MTRTLYQLKNDLLTTLDENRAEIIEDVYPDDRVAEYVDTAIPVYYGDLAAMLADDTSLGFVHDEGLLGDNPDVFTTIQVAIYEELIGVASEWLHETAYATPGA